MPNDNPLYLVREEILLFEKLPEALKSNWKPVIETIDAYESEAEITRRMKDSRFELPGLEAFIKSGGKDGPQFDFSKVSEPAWAEYFYTIGASGTSALIQLSLQSPGLTDEQMDSIAAMSAIRHVILEENNAAKSKKR
ncbi:MAG TPA: hypothetical protein PKV72_02475 [Candidatus Peribacteria bacterium]|nr:hypothetical protein [Candidatus Peribacteria bacterium]